MTITDYNCVEDTDSSGEIKIVEGAEETDAEKRVRARMKEIQQEYTELGEDLELLQNAADADEHTYQFIRMMRAIQTAAEAGDATAIKLGRYAGGSYKASMPEADSDGWISYVKATVSGGEIKELEFNAGKQEDANILITNDPTANSGTEKPSEYYPAIAKSFTESGEDLTRIQAPAGGSVATKTFTKLMKPLLASMLTGGSTDITAPEYVSGTYKAEFEDFDEFGWKDYVVLTIVNDNVTINEFDAISKEDETLKKSDADEANERMKAKTGTSPYEATQELIKRWVDAKNDVTAVENVAGATISSNNFKLLVGQILATSATEGDTTETLKVKRLEASAADNAATDSSSTAA